MSIAGNIATLIVSPRLGWKRIAKFNMPSQQALQQVICPLLAILALSAFWRGASSMIVQHQAGPIIAAGLQAAAVDFAKYFLGYFACVYLLTGFFPSIAADKDQSVRATTAVAYTMAIAIFLSIINNLLPAPWVYVNILYLYIFFVAAKSADYLQLPKNNVYLYLIAAFVILLPAFIGWLLGWILSASLA